MSPAGPSYPFGGPSPPGEGIDMNEKLGMLGVIGGRPWGVIATCPWPGIAYPPGGAPGPWMGGLINGYAEYITPTGDISGDIGCMCCCMCEGNAGSGAGGGRAMGPGCAG